LFGLVLEFISQSKSQGGEHFDDISKYASLELYEAIKAATSEADQELPLRAIDTSVKRIKDLIQKVPNRIPVS